MASKARRWPGSPLDKLTSYPDAAGRSPGGGGAAAAGRYLITPGAGRTTTRFLARAGRGAGGAASACVQLRAAGWRRGALARAGARGRSRAVASARRELLLNGELGLAARTGRRRAPAARAVDGAAAACRWRAGQPVAASCHDADELRARAGAGLRFRGARPGARDRQPSRRDAAGLGRLRRGCAKTCPCRSTPSAACSPPTSRDRAPARRAGCRRHPRRCGRAVGARRCGSLPRAPRVQRLACRRSYGGQRAGSAGAAASTASQRRQGAVVDDHVVGDRPGAAARLAWAAIMRPASAGVDCRRAASGARSAPSRARPPPGPGRSHG